jgi:hypothetical protein
MIIISIFLIFFFGYELTGVFFRKSEALERLSLGFVLGIGLFTLIWFLLNLTGVAYSLLSGTILLLVLIVLLRPFLKSPAWDIRYFKNMDLAEKILLIIIIGLFVSSFIGDLYFPVRHWDSLTLYDFRAKLFAETGFMTKAISNGAFFGYPLLTSLSHTWVYLSGFSNPSFIYSFFYISFVANFFVNLKKLKIKRVAVLFLTLLVTVSPRIFDHSLSAYTNLPYLTYIVMGSIYLYFGIKNKDFGSFIISSVLIGLSTWTRSTEPFWLSCVIVAAIFPLIGKKWLWPVLYILGVGSIMLPWRYFQTLYHEGTVNVAGQVFSASYGVAQSLQPDTVKATLDFVKTNVVYAYFAYFLLLGLVLIYKFVKKSGDWILPILIFLNLGLIVAGSLIFVRSVSYWQDIPDSLTRMAMFVPSLVIFLFAVTISDNRDK